jgi:hypothetical protein
MTIAKLLFFLIIQSFKLVRELSQPDYHIPIWIGGSYYLLWIMKTRRTEENALFNVTVQLMIVFVDESYRYLIKFVAWKRVFHCMRLARWKVPMIC